LAIGDLREYDRRRTIKNQKSQIKNPFNSKLETRNSKLK